MTKSFTFLQLFSLTDGRLSTKMGDVYEMLNHITGQSLTTIALAIAHKQLMETNPPWFAELQAKLEEIKKEAGTDDFPTLIALITEKYNDSYDIPQLTDAEQSFVAEHAHDLLEGKKVITLQA